MKVISIYLIINRRQISIYCVAKKENRYIYIYKSHQNFCLLSFVDFITKNYKKKHTFHSPESEMCIFKYIFWAVELHEVSSFP